MLSKLQKKYQYKIPGKLLKINLKMSGKIGEFQVFSKNPTKICGNLSKKCFKIAKIKLENV